MAMSVTYTNFCGRIIAENRGGAQRAYQRDTLGNTVALLDNTQTSTDTWEYWPFGEVAQRTGSNPTPFAFVGTLGYYTGILEMIYVRARYLLTALGRWLGVDRYWPDEDAYAYCKNRPTTRRDPSGLGLSCAFIYNCPPAKIGPITGILLWCTGTKPATNFHYCRACGLACIASCCTSADDSVTDGLCIAWCTTRQVRCQQGGNFEF